MTYKVNTIVLLSILLSLVVAAPTVGQTVNKPSPIAIERSNGWAGASIENLLNQRNGLPNIVELAESTGLFGTLLAAVDAAGLTAALEGPGPFTVFAPTDAAFSKIPDPTIDYLLNPRNNDLLTKILTFHVVPEALLAADVVSRNSAVTLNGQSVDFTVRGSQVFVERSEITATDFMASNGVVHIIDTVMFPRILDNSLAMPSSVAAGFSQALSEGAFIGSGNSSTPDLGTFGIDSRATLDIVDTAIAADGFNFLVAALKAADLVEALKGRGPFTVFAPTDEAFKDLGRETIRFLLDPANKAQLASILSYHVVPGYYTASDVVNLTSAPTLLPGQELEIKTRGTSVKVNDSAVIAVDILASNGVIHVIDRVLLPE